MVLGSPTEEAAIRTATKGNTLFFKFEEDVIKGVCCSKDTFVCLVNGRLSQRKMIFNGAVF